MAAITASQNYTVQPGEQYVLYPEKPKSSEANRTFLKGELLCYSVDTGGVRTAAHAKTTDSFAGINSEEKEITKHTADAYSLSTDVSEALIVKRKGVIQVATAVGAVDTAKCTAATNGNTVYVATNNEVSVIGTCATALITVGKQVQYVSDTEVYVEIG